MPLLSGPSLLELGYPQAASLPKHSLELLSAPLTTPDAVELALGFNTHNPSSIGYAKGISDLEAYISGDFTGNTHFEIPTFTTDGAGRPEIVWNSPEVIAGTQIRYTVLRTTDLSARWVAITPEVLALSGDAPQLRTFVDTAAPAGAFYKLQAAVEAAP